MPMIKEEEEKGKTAEETDKEIDRVMWETHSWETRYTEMVKDAMKTPTTNLNHCMIKACDMKGMMAEETAKLIDRIANRRQKRKKKKEDTRLVPYDRLIKGCHRHDVRMDLEARNAPPGIVDLWVSETMIGNSNWEWMKTWLKNNEILRVLGKATHPWREVHHSHVLKLAEKGFEPQSGAQFKPLDYPTWIRMPLNQM